MRLHFPFLLMSSSDESNSSITRLITRKPVTLHVFVDQIYNPSDFVQSWVFQTLRFLHFPQPLLEF